MSQTINCSEQRILSKKCGRGGGDIGPCAPIPQGKTYTLLSDNQITAETGACTGKAVYVMRQSACLVTQS